MGKKNTYVSDYGSASQKTGSEAPQPLVARSLRDTEGPQDPEKFRSALISLSSSFPRLKKELTQSGMNFTPAGFVFWALKSSFLASFLLLVVAWIFLRSVNSALLLLALLALPLYFASFLYFMNFPRVKAKMRATQIDSEIVFAGRHMLIELRAGVPLFDSMLGISREYGVVSEEFNKIVEKVTLGVPMGVALHSVADDNPSQYFNRLVLQMANSIASGSDVAATLASSLDQISKEQVIELKAYGQKLNPIAMFFMIFGIIMPSLGIAFMIIVLSFLGGSSISISSSSLLIFLVAVGLVQFLFLSVIESSRPKFDIGL